MDILCTKCGEPWDNDELHELVKSGDFPNYKAAAAAFRKYGCAVFLTKHSEHKASPVVGLIYELLGDDMDGAASELEDAAFFGFLD